MGYWKRKRIEAEVREQDIERARAELVGAKKEGKRVRRQAPQIASMSAYLAQRREQNHFGDALAVSFQPRRNHA